MPGVVEAPIEGANNAGRVFDAKAKIINHFSTSICFRLSLSGETNGRRFGTRPVATRGSCPQSTIRILGLTLAGERNWIKDASAAITLLLHRANNS